MGQFSFDIQNSQDFFEKLKRDYEKFVADNLSSDNAINFSITAYHLFEWTNKELSSIEKETFKLQRQQIEEDFQIVKDITNGTKHKEIDRYIPKLRTAKKHRGTFSKGFNRDFDISALLVVLEDGRELYFKDIVERVYAFWMHIYTKQN